MNKSIQLIVFIGAIFFATGCFQPVDDVELPEVNPQLVVFSFISPEESAIKVYVTRSQPVFNHEYSYDYPPVEDATVIISDGVQNATLDYDQMAQAYVISQDDFSVVPKRTYSLTVTTAEGEKATASTVVPGISASGFDISKCNVDTIIDEYIYRQPVVRIKWIDDPGKGNYYRVLPILIDSTSFSIDSMIIYPYGEMGMKSDKKNNGSEMQVNYGRNNVDKIWINSDIYNSKYIVYLYCVDVHYYNYHNTIGQVNFEDNPFAQPSPFYNSVKGGLGVFGSYRIQMAEKNL